MIYLIDIETLQLCRRPAVYGVDMNGMGTAERIASAALAILTEEGARAVTMRRVAADAGVTAMAAYRHYPNREALLRTVVDAAYADLAKDWGTRCELLDVERRIDCLVDDYLDFALGKPNLCTFLITERREEALRFPEDFREGGSPAFAPVFQAVEQGIQDGVLRPDDALEATLAITMPVMGLVQLYLGNRVNLSEPDFRALCRRTIGRVLDGLRA